MRIVFWAHTQFQGSTFRVSSHHLARELARRGHDVLHIAPARSPTRVRGDSLKQLVELPEGFSEVRVEHMFPPVELLKMVRVASLADRLVSRSVVRSLLGHGASKWFEADLAFVDKVDYGTAAALMAPARLIYRPTDVFSRNGRLLQDRELRLAMDAEQVIGTSQVVVDRLSERLATKALVSVVRNGAPVAALSVHEGDHDARVAIYVGAIDHRLDIDSLRQVADLLPSWKFLIYGPRPRRTLGPENLSFCGPIAPSALGPALAAASVGLMPFKPDSVENQGRSPMKHYEYRAVRLPIVAARVDEMEVRNDPGVFFYDDAASFAVCLEKAFAYGASSSNSVLDADVSEMDWASVCDRYLEILEL
jgi:teichuronic acid biosynthesis glycosyltransferase TuaH